MYGIVGGNSNGSGEVRFWEYISVGRGGENVMEGRNCFQQSVIFWSTRSSTLFGRGSGRRQDVQSVLGHTISATFVTADSSPQCG